MSERYWEGRWRDTKADNENLCIVLAQKDNEIYELRQRMAGLDYKIEQLQDALAQGRIRDQSIIDEAIKASTKVKDEVIARLRKDVELLEASRREIIEIDEQRVAEIARLHTVIDRYEEERISRLGGIGSPA